MNSLKLISLIFILSSCSTPLPENTTQSEIITESPEILQINLWNSVLDYFSKKKMASDTLSHYLETIFKKLYPNDHFSDDFKFYITQLNQSNLDFISIIYPEKGALIDYHQLKKNNGENELAALLAFGYERSKLISYRERLNDETKKLNNNCERIVHFLNDENIEATKNTLDVLYNAGYDLRSVLEVFSRIPESSEKTIESLKEVAQRKIFLYPPLVNPILRTSEYYKFQKEIEKL